MSTDLIFQKIEPMVRRLLGLGKEEIKLDSKIRDDLGADDLDMIELSLTVEDAYDIEIPDIDLEAFETVQDVVDFVAANT